MSRNYSLKNVSVRLVKETPLFSKKRVNNCSSAVTLIQNYLKDMDREVFGILCLNTQGQPICFSQVAVGTLNSAMIEMREVFKVALLSNASAVIAFHCHPSGSVVPSSEDISLTDRLIKSGRLLGVPVFDHIIVGCGSCSYYSMAEKRSMNTDMIFTKELDEIDFGL